MKPGEIDSPPWMQFESLVVRILELNAFQVQTHSPQGDVGYDLDAILTDQRWAIEVKFYRSARTQLSLIEAAAARVTNNALAAGISRAALVVSSLLTPEQRITLEEKYSATFIDRADLTIMASADPGLLDELNAILEARSDLSDQPTLITGSTNRFKDNYRAPLRSKISQEGRNLADRLSRVRAGRSSALKYESLCIEILKFLFGNDLVGWKEQNPTEDKLNRFDCICRAKPTHEFWRFIIEDLGSRYVVFEFKNYSEAITQGQMLTTEKYLLAPALRKVAFVLTRKGGDIGAHKTAGGAMREHGKLMLILDDNAVTDMLLKRDQGTDPTDIMFDRTDEFMLTLSR